jgi:branched-chain amino acid aminotransferase
MEKVEYIFHKGEFVKWDDATTHFLTHSLHYGDGAFEGIRAYQTSRGAAVFRLREHMERLQYSVKPLRMELPYSVDELCQITVELIKKNNLKHCYIRPLAYYDAGVMGLNPRDNKPVVSIACWPWGAYLPHESVDIKISSFIRVHPKTSVVDAKLSAHYLNSMMAVFEIRDTKYHEALLCDYEDNIAEGPGENFFMVKDGVVITPKLGNILAGITRATIMQICADEGIKVREETISKEQVFSADEAFFTGTAAEVTPIRSINDTVLKNVDSKGVGPITAKIKEIYLNTVAGKVDKYKHFLTYCD